MSPCVPGAVRRMAAAIALSSVILGGGCAAGEREPVTFRRTQVFPSGDQSSSWEMRVTLVVNRAPSEDEIRTEIERQVRSYRKLDNLDVLLFEVIDETSGDQVAEGEVAVTDEGAERVGKPVAVPTIGMR